MRRWIRWVMLAVIAVGPSSTAHSKDRDIALRYDGARKRFTCVGPRVRPPAPAGTVGAATCPQGWEPYYPGISFERGDTIYLQISNTHYDAFLEVTAQGTALTPPPLVPVAGQADLKTIAGLLPDATKVGGKGAEQKASLSANRFIESVAKEDPAQAVKLWEEFVAPVRESVRLVWPMKVRLEDHRSELRAVKSEAERVSVVLADPIQDYLNLRVRFERRLDEQAAIANEMLALSHVTDVYAPFESTNATLALDVAEILAGPLAKVRPRLEKLAKEATITLPSDVILARNLATFAASDLETVTRWAALPQALPDLVREINDTIPMIALRLNTLPSQLPQEVTEYRLGQWFDNTTVSVTVAAAPRFEAYKVGAVLTTTEEKHKPQSGDSKESDEAPVNAPTDGDDDKPAFIVAAQTTPNTSLETKTIATAVFEVHQLYHFRIAPGIAYSKLNDVKYEEVTRTVPDGVDDEGKPKTREERYLLQTRDRDYQIFPTANLVWYPIARDLFPGKWKPAFGLLAGLSLVDPRRDFVVGVSIELTPAVAFYGGRHYGYQPELPPGVALGQALPVDKPAFVENKLGKDWFWGFTFDLTLFKQLFGALGF